MRSETKPAEKSTRIVFHSALKASWSFGLLLIAMGILGLPQMSFITGRLAASFATFASFGLVLAGVAWLFAVKVFVHFFDRYLSSN